jgi:putative nucleotidyltransferase with HDIG domain
MVDLEKIRLNVIKSLPEAKEIQNKDLREKVYDAWTLSLSESGLERIEDLPGSGVPGYPSVKGGTQAEHLRGVARIGMGVARELKAVLPDFSVDMDEVIAGGLCHDLGKPFEYDARNRKKWDTDPEAMGRPSIRHSVYGVHMALKAGLPEKIAHIAGAHSMEGDYLTRSLACEIIHFADYGFWAICNKAGTLDGPLPHHPKP